MADARDLVLVAGLGLLAYAAWGYFGASASGDGGSDDVNTQTLEQIASTYADAISTASAAYGVPQPLIVGVIARESGGDPNAVGDGGQARGLMQMHPAAAQDAGGNWDDLFDPSVAINLGTHYLAQQLARFGGDETLALVAYNQGPGVASAGPSDHRFAAGQGYAATVLSYAQQIAAALATLVQIPAAAPADYNPFSGVTD